MLLSVFVAPGIRIAQVVIVLYNMGWHRIASRNVTKGGISSRAAYLLRYGPLNGIPFCCHLSSS